MTSIRDLLGDTLAVGDRFCLHVDDRDGQLVASHPHAASPMDIAVVERLDRLDEQPPTAPIKVEIRDRIVDDRLAGRVIGVDCGEPDNVSRS